MHLYKFAFITACTHHKFLHTTKPQLPNGSNTGFKFDQ